MIVLLRNENGPVEGWTRATFRTAISDTGIGEVGGLPEFIDPLTGTRIVVTVNGVDAFAFTVEERLSVSEDVTEVTGSGRGPAADLERVVVLPPNYPNFTERNQTLSGPPFAIFGVELLAQAQARGRLAGFTITWDAVNDSKGDPWQANVTLQLEPGVDFSEILREAGEIEGAEFLVRPDLSIEAAPVLGEDRSTEVVLFVGKDQVSRGRRESRRRQRQTVFLEASTGVSEITNASLDATAGEVWLEGQDFADPTTRPFVAAQIAAGLSDPDVEVDVRVTPDCGIFTRFDIGDIIGLDTGEGPIEFVRVVGASVQVEPDNIEVELTLVSEIALRSQQIDRAIQAKADVRLAASTSFQRRHGLVTADKFLSGAIGGDVAIASSNFVSGIDGFEILGDGSAQFNDVVIRGDLESPNYDPGVVGWQLSRTGDIELNEGTFRGGLVGGTINIGGAQGFFANGVDGIFLGAATFGSAPFRVNLAGALTATSGSISGNIVAAGINAANLTVGFLNVDRIQAGTIQGAKISDATLTGVKIIDGEIGGVKIADLAVTTAKIGNEAVSNQKVFPNLNGDRLSAGTISGLSGNFVNLSTLQLSVTLDPANFNGVISTTGSFSNILRNAGMPTSTDTTLPIVRRRGDDVLVSTSSSQALKAEIADAAVDMRVLDLKPRTWRSLADGDDPDRRYYGLVAEEVAAAGLDELVYAGLDGRPAGVAYDMLGLTLIPIVRRLAHEIAELKEGLDG